VLNNGKTKKKRAENLQEENISQACSTRAVGLQSQGRLSNQPWPQTQTQTPVT